MDQELNDDFIRNLYASYTSRRPKSESLFKAARDYMPGGDTRSVTFYKPFPTFIEKGEGCRLTDADGHVYIDLVNNYTSLIHGHAHPSVVKAVTEQVRKGSTYGSPTECQYKLAQEICHRLPSADKVRFCNSGTEATIGAIRLARAFTKKYKIAKMEGGYHGSHDLVEISIGPSLDSMGPIDEPVSVPEDVSIPPNVVKDCIIVPFNNTEVAKQIITKNREDLAAIIVEPVQGAGGMVPAELEFVKAVRELATEYKIPLIFDEVITFRLTNGGWQEMYNILPDLTALGKIIGGGYPVGGIAGREEFMDFFSPLNDAYLSHSGTFNGNSVTMTAGLATLKELTISEIERINDLGGQLRGYFSKALEEVGVKGEVTGIGSLGQIHFIDKGVIDWRSAVAGRKDLNTILHLLLMDKGVFFTPRGLFCISTAMGEAEINEIGIAFKSCLLEMKPYIGKRAPELLTRP